MITRIPWRSHDSQEKKGSQMERYEIFISTLARNRLALAGSAVVMIIILLSVFSPILPLSDPNKIDLSNTLAPPSLEAPLGRDQYGRPILSRILFGYRISLQVGVLGVLVAAVFGTILGAIAGYFGGIIDTIIMRIVDMVLAIPGLLLAIAVIAALGPGINNLVIVLALVFWTSYARVVRSKVLTIRELEYVQAAKAMGAGSLRIILDHILPNSLAEVIVLSTLYIGTAILWEASLSFIGMGVPPPTASLGSMLAEGRDFLLIAPHIATFPGLAITIAVLGLNLLGDGLRDALDPRMRI
jgi:peptide/nickel transport system permease protein